MRFKILLNTWLILFISYSLYAYEVSEQQMSEAELYLKSIEKNFTSQINEAENLLEQIEVEQTFTNDEHEIISQYNESFGEHQQCKKKGMNQLMIFISSSMNKENIIQWSEDANRFGGTLILRGFIDNSLAKTADYIKSMSEYGVGVIIDPISYQKFLVSHVPTVVLLPDSHTCVEGCNETPLHDKISGNISLEYALREIAQKGYESASAAQNLIDKFGGDI